MVYGHEFGDACLGKSLESDLLVGESFCHAVEDIAVDGDRVVYPEDLAMSRRKSMLRDYVREHLREPLLIHAGDVIEARAELVNVGTDTRTLSGDVRMVLYHEQIARLQCLVILC